MRRHGLTDWELAFDNARTRFGVCRPARRQIGLSRRLTKLSSPEEVRNTVLHEIAHALVGAEHGHDEVWRAKALAIGSDGTRTDDLPDGAEGPWQGRCPAGHTANRHRRPRRVASCRTCSPKAFDPAAIYEWTWRGQPAPMLSSCWTTGPCSPCPSRLPDAADRQRRLGWHRGELSRDRTLDPLNPIEIPHPRQRGRPNCPR
ncbi:MAG: SprT-like domain-containing protein [Actinobacteria bacterium]|nr:SprT-like domain-containing protein [Actinomycetota bacterium]